jgi:hypothetical protein
MRKREAREAGLPATRIEGAGSLTGKLLRSTVSPLRERARVCAVLSDTYSN